MNIHTPRVESKIYHQKKRNSIVLPYYKILRLSNIENHCSDFTSFMISFAHGSREVVDKSSF